MAGGKGRWGEEDKVGANGDIYNSVSNKNNIGMLL